MQKTLNQTQPRCNKCGGGAPLDIRKSTKEFKAYKTDKPCNCGGQFCWPVTEVSPRLELEEVKEVLDCRTCDISQYINKDLLYVPCVTHCIRNGRPLQ